MRGATKQTLLLLVAVALVAARKKPSGQGRYVFQWILMEPCPECMNQNATVTLRYLRNGDVRADVDFNIITAAKTISKVQMLLTSCNDDGSGCEHFMKFRAPMDGCAFVAAKNAFWTPGFKNVQPPFTCPIAATHYTNLNWTIDKDLLSKFPLPRNRLWKNRMEMYNEGDELFWCYVFHFIFKELKARN